MVYAGDASNTKEDMSSILKSIMYVWSRTKIREQRRKDSNPESDPESKKDPNFLKLQKERE